MGVSVYQTKEGRRYKAILYVSGVAASSKRGFLTKKEARSWLTLQEAAMTAAPLPEETRTAFSTVADAYLTDMQVRRQRNTYVYKKSTINRLLAYMGGDFFLDDLTSAAIDRYMFEQLRERGAKSANRDLLELKAVLNWGIRKDMALSNPFRRSEPFAEEKFSRYVPPTEDVAKVRSVAQGQERDFVDFLYFTGARLSEACNLRWFDLDFQNRTISLWTRKRRGGGHEDRSMAMVTALMAILDRRAKDPDCHDTHVFTNPSTGKPLTKNTAWTINLFGSLCERAGVKRFTAHCMRHFVATRLKDSKQATSFQIQNFLGHQNLSTTEKYLHELDVDRVVAELLEDTESTIPNRIEPQIEPQVLTYKK